MKYQELKEVFKKLKRKPFNTDLTAHIVFSEESFTEPYSQLSRTYRVSSNNKAYIQRMSSNSIFGYCLDGTDQGVRLDWFIADEGNKDGWIISDCYILEHMRDAAAIPNYGRTVQTDGSIGYHFGDTYICVDEMKVGNRLILKPISGDQVACGQWYDLSIDQVYGYCTLLERHLNKGV